MGIVVMGIVGILASHSEISVLKLCVYKDHFLCLWNLSGSLDDIVLASLTIQIFKFTPALMFVLSDTIWVPGF